MTPHNAPHMAYGSDSYVYVPALVSTTPTPIPRTCTSEYHPNTNSSLLVSIFLALEYCNSLPHKQDLMPWGECEREARGREVRKEREGRMHGREEGRKERKEWDGGRQGGREDGGRGWREGGRGEGEGGKE